ncbi:MAG: ABC transporter permease [Acidobacteriota bacterium]
MAFGVVALCVVTFAGAFAPWLAPYDPNEQVDALAGRLLPPGSTRYVVQHGHRRLLAEEVQRVDGEVRFLRLGEWRTLPADPAGGNGAEAIGAEGDGIEDRRVFLLGTDKFGRDLLSRCLWGARVSLLLGAASVVLALLIGVGVGAVAALGGRWLDLVLMRFVDGLLAFPWIFLLIALTAFFPTDLPTLVLLLGGTAWMPISRLARAEIQSLAGRDFVLAAHGLGIHPVRVFLRHVLPNVASPLAVEATLRVGTLILVEAAISFLGFGVQPPHASWGNLIADGREHLSTAWWVALFPSLLLVITLTSISLVSDGLRDLLDPERPQPID